MILSGKELSSVVKNDVSKQCSAYLNRFGRKPTLAVVLVGENPASQIYVNNKKKACDEWGLGHVDVVLDASVSEEELLKKLEELNNDSKIDGILVQLPLPKQIDEQKVIASINAAKDVDGFSPANIGKLLLGEKTMVACTPKGILRILDYYNIPTAGKNVCVIGRSNIVGKPIAALLMQKGRDATVTVCHSKTADLKEKTKDADILIASIGVANYVKADMIKDGAVIIDVGINRIDDPAKKSGKAVVGDVDYNDVCEKVSAITPVPGGVGPMTVAMLMENTVIAACNQKGIEVADL